jgi:hypothetical protein
MKGRQVNFAGKSGIVLLAMFLAGCGGGGGGGSPGNNNDGQGNDNNNQANFVVDCNGTNCGATANGTYSGSGVGIWKYTNSGTATKNANLSLTNVNGKTVTIVLTNGGDDDVILDSASYNSDISSNNNLRSANIKKADETPHYNNIPTYVRDFNMAELMQKITPKSVEAQKNIRANAYAEGNQTKWRVDLNDSNSATLVDMTLKKRIITPNGTAINFWVQDSEWNNVSPYLNTFSSTFANKVYDNIVNVAGAPWGSYSSDYDGFLIPASEKDINILIAKFSQNNLLGYFWGVNNVVYNQATNPNSNEALVLFVNSTPLSKTDGVNTMLSTMAHEALHMILFYQRSVRMSTGGDFPTFLGEMVAIMMEDVVANNISSTYNDVRESNYADWLNNNDFVDGYGDGTFNCDFTMWTTGGANYCGDQEYVNYAVTGSFGAYLLRRYGMDFYVNLLKEPMGGTNERLAAISTIDRAIKKSVSTDSIGIALAKWGAGISLFSPSATPANYGYPIKSYTVNGVRYNLVAFGDPGTRTLPSSAPSALVAHGHHPMVYTSSRPNFEKTIKVPAGVTATVVVK